MYISQFDYYSDSANFGNYQYVSLEDIVNNFELMFAGNNNIINNVPRYKILFYAKRAIQELNYDAFKEVKVLQLNVGEDLRFILPSDYVNFIRISLFKDGVVRPLNENVQINYATQYLQATNGVIMFDGDNNVIPVNPSEINEDRLNGTLRTMYLNPDNPNDNNNGNWGWCIDGCWTFGYNIGARFGLNTDTANFNPTYRIDSKAGVINFSSDMANQSCIIEYISDGMENGDDSSVTVNKLFEQFIYEEIEYQIAKSKIGVQEYIVERMKKSRGAKLRNAKIRMSNIHPGRLLMNMRGVDKIIK